MATIDPLAALLRSADDGALEALLIRATITSWNGTTGANTVAANGVTYTNLPFLGPLASLGAGAALLISTPGSPVILGRLYFPPI
jgi:hypothetical protein